MGLRLETKRLILRPPTRDDAEALVRAINHPQIAATTLNIPHPYRKEHAIEWIERTEKPDKVEVGIPLNVFLKGTGELVGGVGLSGINDRHKKAELGYWCAVDHWNKGITTEATEMMVRHGFEELGLERIHAICMVNNPASARVMEKVGMVLEGTARHEFMKDGDFADFHHYAILRSDWEQGRR